mgnify:FL=1
MREIFSFDQKLLIGERLKIQDFYHSYTIEKIFFTEVFYLSCIVFIEVFLTFLYNLIAFLKIFNMKIF